MSKVRKRRRTTLTSKHQLTVPVETMAEAGLKAGDQLVARADGPGRVVFEREEDPIEEFKGALTGVYPTGALDDLRREWD